MIWRDVVGFEGRYEVSDEGSVRNAQTGRMLKPQRCTNRYLALCLGRKNRRLVHRLVAEAFIPNPDRKPHTNHKNGKRADNRAENLEWVTCSENHVHAHHQLPRKTHARQRAVVLSDGRRFASVSAAAVTLGVADGSVSSAVRLGHRCKGYTVQYV